MVAKSSTEPKLRFSKEYRVMIAQRATELANLSLGDMVFVQFAPMPRGEQGWSPRYLVLSSSGYCTYSGIW
jgi:hypothetical protein